MFGYIKLCHNPYLILVEKASVVGQIMKGTVLRVDKLMFVPLAPNGLDYIHPGDKPFIEMIQHIQKEKAFYFSYQFDLTKNVQLTFLEAQNGVQPTFSNAQITKTYNEMKHFYPNSLDNVPQYTFNNNILKELKGLEYSPFKLPCIWGYVFVSSPNIKIGSKTDFCLVSRKDCRRPGRRFITRGIDMDGCVANFCETEHIFVKF